MYIQKLYSTLQWFRSYVFSHYVLTDKREKRVGLKTLRKIRTTVEAAGQGNVR